MKKAIISVDSLKKIKAINELTQKALVVLPTSEKAVLGQMKVPFAHIFVEDLSKAVSFLDFQTKVNDDVVLVIYNCLRFNDYANTKYNKIFVLCAAAENCLVIDSFPFVFDHRNLWVIQKMLGVEKYHPKQFYDDAFFVEQGGETIQANSLKAIYADIEPYLYTDIEPINLMVHEWAHTEEENSHYEKFKYELLYETQKNGRDLTKVNIVTWLQGTSNRFESKLKSLLAVLATINCKPIIIYNWDKGISEHKPKVPYIVDMVSYHQKTNDTDCDVLFFETIISQKIKFYDKLAQYAKKSKLHFFINPKLGADKKVVNATIEIVKKLNEFAEYKWKKI